MSAAQNATRSTVKMHVGNALMHLAETYPHLTEVVYEAVQNAIDGNAQNVWLTFDQVRRKITVSDDGHGVGRAEFDACLRQICLSRKTTAKDKFGRFGLGFISPLGKCAEFSFMSVSDKEDSSLAPELRHCWSFKTSSISKLEDDVSVPCVEKVLGVFFPKKHDELLFQYMERRALNQQAGQPALVPFRSVLTLLDYSEDKHIARIADWKDLSEEIFSRFGEVMRKKSIFLHMRYVMGVAGSEKVIEKSDMTPSDFTGKPLQIYKSPRNAFGSITVTLYLTKTERGRRDGRVLFGEDADPYRFTIPQFLRAHGEMGLRTEVADALKSGIFEGVVVGTGVRLAPNRKQFEETEGLLQFCEALNTWFDDHGKEHMHAEKTQRDKYRYQEVGLKALNALQSVLGTAEGSVLRQAMDLMKRGTVGGDHADAPLEGDGSVVGIQKMPAKAVVGEKPANSNARPQSGNPQGEHRAHRPLTVAGPLGQQRAQVKNSSLGLQFSFEWMDLERRLWVLDDTNGILRFNTRHPLFEECEDDDKLFQHFQEVVAVTALHLMVHTLRQSDADVRVEQAKAEELLMAQMALRMVK
jgi:Histidine kinase-, DNA gyrase B-, and HSP90-like ATPase